MKETPGAVRVLVVGAGAIADLVVPDAYRQAGLPAEVVGVVDLEPQRARELADRMGCRAYPSLDAALADTGADAVDLRTPHHAHLDLALHAIEADLHVLVEKPVTVRTEEGRRIVAAAHRRGRTVAVAENYPHLAAVAAARALITDGTLGDLVAVQLTRVYQLGGVWLRDGWRTDGGTAAGVLLDQATHQTALLECLAGPVTAVTTTGARTAGDGKPGGEDTVLMTYELASGLVAQGLISWVGPTSARFTEARVYGSAGALEVVVDYEGDGGGVVTQPGDGRVAAGENYYASHRAIVADFVDAVRTGRAPTVTGDDGLRHVAVLAAARESLARGGVRVEVSALD